MLSSLRVGSTWLAKTIADNINYEYFHEVCKNVRQQRELYSFSILHKNYVLKEHTHLFLQRYPESFIKQPAYRIRLLRRDIFRQVISYYVAFVRDKYMYHNVHRDIYFGEEIKLEKDILLHKFEEIKRYNNSSLSFPHPIDLELFYEDLQLPQGDIIPTTLPKNNDEFVAWAWDILKDKL